MNVRPLLSSLLRHRASTGIVITGIALTLAVLTNAMALVTRHVQHLRLSAGSHATLAHFDLLMRDLIPIGLSSGVVAIVLALTVLGLYGLASSRVKRHARQIGLRRALGASRLDIVQQLQTENLLLTTAGIALGAVAAISINFWLMSRYAVPRLPLSYLPIGALILWNLGQLAVLAPALRAAAVPPAAALRSG